MKQIRLIAAALLAGAAFAAPAGAILFDPTGGGGATTNLSVDMWDWAPSTALAAGAITPNQNPALPGQLASDFTLYTFGSLGSYWGAYTLPDGTPRNGGYSDSGKLNSLYEITFVGGFGELVTSVSGTTANFGLDASNPVNFFQMYISPVNSDNYLSSSADTSGTNFQDGTLLLSGRISDTSGSFTNNGTPQPLDQTPFNGNQWGSQLSVQGEGSSEITVAVKPEYLNENYFPEADFLDLNNLILEILFSSKNRLPFIQVDPANRIWNGSAYVTPNLGAVNGLYGPDVLFEMDGSQTQRVVPEPGTMILLGSGLLGLAGAARRRTQK